MTRPNKSPIVVALDVSELTRAKELIYELKDFVSYFKIGYELFMAHGWKAVEVVKQSGANVFLDLKLHDIPNTVKKSVSVICSKDVDMLTVHTLGGLEMLKGVSEIIQKENSKLKVLGVTILTSHSEEQMKNNLGIAKPLKDQVASLASLAEKAKLSGVVCSPQEAVFLRKKMGDDFLLVCPGVRPAGDAKADQKRVCTPEEAMVAGASYLVIGRPIVEASDPRASASAILKSINLTA